MPSVVLCLALSAFTSCLRFSPHSPSSSDRREWKEGGTTRRPTTRPRRGWSSGCYSRSLRSLCPYVRWTVPSLLSSLCHVGNGPTSPSSVTSVPSARPSSSPHSLRSEDVGGEMSRQHPTDGGGEDGQTNSNSREASVARRKA